MSEMPLSADQGYLENLMRAGQDAMKQYDDALASATGVQTEESLIGASALPLCVDRRPSARIPQADMARLWNAMFLQTFFRRNTCGRCPDQGRQAVQGRIVA